MKEVIERIKSKSVLKYQVYQNTRHVFQDLKKVARDFALQAKNDVEKVNKNITVEFTDKGEFEAELKVAGDMLLFIMHTNVFEFPRSHQIMKSSYIRDDISRSYSGIIYVYNFLADSFKYSRQNDVGYLVARIFINKEFHFIVEGKRQMEFLDNSFIDKKINKEAIKKILETAILYCIDFDLLLPPYENVKEVSVSEMMEYSFNMATRTGKRLGFRFQTDPAETL